MVQTFRVLLRQLSYAIKNQLKAPKAPIGGLWDEIPPLGGISCLSLVLYGIRAPIIDPFRAWKPPLCHKEPGKKGKKYPPMGALGALSWFFMA